MNFDKVNQLLDKYKDNNGGYESFEKVSKTVKRSCDTVIIRRATK